MFFKNKGQPKQQPPEAIKSTTRQQLLDITLRVVSVNRNSEFTDNDSTPESMRNYLDRNARETAVGEAQELFYLEHKGVHLYPVFTSTQRLEEWLEKNPFAGKQFTAITVLSFQGSRLFPRFLNAPPSVIVVLDPMSNSERFLGHEELQALAQF